MAVSPNFFCWPPLDSKITCAQRGYIKLCSSILPSSFALLFLKNHLFHSLLVLTSAEAGLDKKKEVGVNRQGWRAHTLKQNPFISFSPHGSIQRNHLRAAFPDVRILSWRFLICRSKIHFPKPSVSPKGFFMVRSRLKWKAYSGGMTNPLPECNMPFGKFVIWYAHSLICLAVWKPFKLALKIHPWSPFWGLYFLFFSHFLKSFPCF